MAEQYLGLGPGDRREVLEFAASESGRPAYLLEKDIWLVWALRTPFDSPMGAPLVFKGGTSLSKAYGAIRRFSEDVDLTHDIRALVPDLVDDSPHPLPANRSQEKRWTREIRERLTAWIQDAAAPFLAEALRAVEAHGEVRIENAATLLHDRIEGTRTVSHSLRARRKRRSDARNHSSQSSNPSTPLWWFQKGLNTYRLCRSTRMGPENSPFRVVALAGTH